MHSKFIKRILALFLAIILAFSLFPPMATATDMSEDAPGTISLVNALTENEAIAPATQVINPLLPQAEAMHVDDTAFVLGGGNGFLDPAHGVWNTATSFPVATQRAPQHGGAATITNATARVLWDDNNLYVRVEWTRNVTAGATTGMDGWITTGNAHEQDCVEIWLSEMNHRGARGSMGAQFRVGVNGNISGDQFGSVTVANGYSHAWNAVARRNVQQTFSQVDSVGNATVTAAVPFRTNQNITLEDGLLVGFDISINGQAGPGGAHRAVYGWGDPVDNNWNSTENFGQLILDGGGTFFPRLGGASNLQFAPVGASQGRMSWAPVPDAVAYRVYVGGAPANWEAGGPALVNAPATHFYVQDLGLSGTPTDLHDHTIQIRPIADPAAHRDGPLSPVQSVTIPLGQLPANVLYSMRHDPELQDIDASGGPVQIAGAPHLGYTVDGTPLFGGGTPTYLTTSPIASTVLTVEEHNGMNSIRVSDRAVRYAGLDLRLRPLHLQNTVPAPGTAYTYTVTFTGRAIGPIPPGTVMQMDGINPNWSQQSSNIAGSANIPANPTPGLEHPFTMSANLSAFQAYDRMHARVWTSLQGQHVEFIIDNVTLHHNIPPAGSTLSRWTPTTHMTFASFQDPQAGEQALFTPTRAGGANWFWNPNNVIQADINPADVPAATRADAYSAPVPLEGAGIRLTLPEPLTLGTTWQLDYEVWVPATHGPTAPFPQILINRDVFATNRHTGAPMETIDFHNQQPTFNAFILPDIPQAEYADLWAIPTGEWVQRSITLPTRSRAPLSNHIETIDFVFSGDIQPAEWRIRNIEISYLNPTIAPPLSLPHWDMELPSLNETFEPFWQWGNIYCVSWQMMRGNTIEHFVQQYSIVTAENWHKPDELATVGAGSDVPFPGAGYLRPGVTESIVFDRSDRVVRFAIENDLTLHGHTLQWHSQSPRWLTENADGTFLHRTEARENLRWWIRTIANHYNEHPEFGIAAGGPGADIFASWDVINEVVGTTLAGATANGTNQNPADWRPGDWRESLRAPGVGVNKWRIAFANFEPGDVPTGETWHESDFVYYTYVYARYYFPAAMLFYNDYNEQQIGKRRVIANMIWGVNERWAADYDNNPEADSTMTLEAYIEDGRRLLIEAFGLQQHFSTVAAAPGHLGQFTDLRRAFELYSSLGVRLAVTEWDSNITSMAQQAEHWRQLTSLYLEFADYLDVVINWGKAGIHSWRPTPPPVAFDNAYDPQPNFWSVIEVGEQARQAPEIAPAAAVHSAGLNQAFSLQLGVTHPIFRPADRPWTNQVPLEIVSHTLAGSGLAIDENGLISGTPTQTGTFTVTVSAETPHVNAVTTRTFTILVLDIPQTAEVTFMRNHDPADDTVHTTQSVLVTGNASAPHPAPAAPVGYRFNGWALDRAGLQPFNFGTGITADMNLYARWISATTRELPLEINFRPGNWAYHEDMFTPGADVMMEQAVGHGSGDNHFLRVTNTLPDQHRLRRDPAQNSVRITFDEPLPAGNLYEIRFDIFIPTVPGLTFSLPGVNFNEFQANRFSWPLVNPPGTITATDPNGTGFAGPNSTAYTPQGRWVEYVMHTPGMGLVDGEMRRFTLESIYTMDIRFHTNTAPGGDAPPPGGARMIPGVWHLDNIRVTLLEEVTTLPTVPSTVPSTGWDAALAVPSLAEAWEDYFPIGNIAEPFQLGDEFTDMFTHHFNFVTPENVMKPIYHSFGICGDTDTLIADFTQVDQFLDWAEDNDIPVQAHTLVWHSGQSPWFLNQNEDGSPLTRAQAQRNMEIFIRDFVGHTEGRVAAWDVVNEVVNPPGGFTVPASITAGQPPGVLNFDAVGPNWWQGGLRDWSPWQVAYSTGVATAPPNVDGRPLHPSDYIYDAFVFTRLADPSAILYYNDYNEINNTRTIVTSQMVLELNNRWADDPRNTDVGRPLIEVIGMQGHFWAGRPNPTTGLMTGGAPAIGHDSLAAVETAILRYTLTAGVYTSVTELDAPIGNWGSWGGATWGRVQAESQLLTPLEEMQQAIFYARLMELYRTHADSITRVTLWGVSDNLHWRHQGMPVLFDYFQQPKLAFDAFLDPTGFLADNTFDVRFMRNDGTTDIHVERQVLWGTTIAPVLANSGGFQPGTGGAAGVANPVREGHLFRGWGIRNESGNIVMNNAANNGWNFGNAIGFHEGPTTFYAIWTSETFPIEVTFAPGDRADFGEMFNPGPPGMGQTASTVSWVTGPGAGYDDNYALRINRGSNFAAAQNTVRITPPFPLPAGYTYEFRAMIYVPIEGNAGRSTPRGGANTVVHPLVTPNGSGGGGQGGGGRPTINANYHWIPMGEWVEFVVDIRPQFVEGVITFFDFRPGGSNAANMPDVWYIDDIRITQDQQNLGRVDHRTELWTLHPGDLPSLSQAHTNYFPIGSIVEPAQIGAQDPHGYMRDHFAFHYDQVTAENAMKPQGWGGPPAAPFPATGGAGQIEAWAAANNLDLHGHTLIWHSQSPSWPVPGNAVTHYLHAQERMQLYIDTVVERFADSVTGWDVLNEVFWYNTDGPLVDPRITGDWRQGLRSWDIVEPGVGNGGTGGSGSRWLRSYNVASVVPNPDYGVVAGAPATIEVRPDCPSDYIYDAFVFTRLALIANGRGEVLSYYNDFNEEIAPKRYSIAMMVEELNNRWIMDPRNTDPGRPLIDVIGMQAHFWTGWIDPVDVQASIDAFVQAFENTSDHFDYLAAQPANATRFAGVTNRIVPRLSVTELDLVQGTYYNQHNGRRLTESQEMSQAVLYAQLFQIYRAHADIIESVTFWGREDDHGWRANGMPLLFDTYYQPKLAFWAVIDPDAFLARPDVVAFMATSPATITFNPNGGVAGTESLTVRYGKAVDRAEIENPTRAEHTFLGWSFTPTPSPASPGLPAAPFALSSFHVHNTADITLYAIWAEETYHDVTFVDIDDADDSEVIRIRGGDALNPDLIPEVSREGYMLQGWTATPGGTVITDWSAVIITGSTTFYPVWNAITVVLAPISVTVNDGDPVATATVSGTATSAITLDTADLPAGVTAAVNQEIGVITVTGVRPSTDVPPIAGTFEIEVTRGGVTETLAVTVNLTTTWVAPTLTLVPPTVTINNGNRTATSAVGGTVTGTIALNTTNLPAGVTAAVNQETGVITVTGVRPSTDVPPIAGTFEIEVTRGGVTETLAVTVNLTTTWVAPTLTLVPPTVTVNNGNPVATTTVIGTATGTITLDTTDLPAGVTATVNQDIGTGMITVTGVRPSTDVPPIAGTFEIGVTRGGVTETLAVTVNLTTTWVAPTLTLAPDAVTVNNGNLVAASTIGGTATGNITLDTTDLPAGVTAAVNQETGVITVTGVRPSTDVPPIAGTFEIEVTRGGVTETLAVTVNLTTTWAPIEVEYEMHPAYIFGNAQGYFQPGENATRAHVATILARVKLLEFEQGIEALPAGMEVFDAFADVNEGDWFYYYIAWAYDAGLVEGFNGYFRPDDYITREELAAIMVRTLDAYEETAGELPFDDAALISDWALHYVYTAFNEGLVIGNGRNFNPLGYSIRADVATIANRILGRIDSWDALNAAEVVNRQHAFRFPDVAATAWYYPSILAAANDHRLTRDDDDAIDWKYFIRQVTP